MITRESFEKVINANSLGVEVKYVSDSDGGDYWDLLVPDPEEPDLDILLARLYCESLDLEIPQMGILVNMAELLLACGGIEQYEIEQHVEMPPNCDECCYIYHVLEPKQLMREVLNCIACDFSERLDYLKCIYTEVENSLLKCENK